MRGEGSEPERLRLTRRPAVVLAGAGAVHARGVVRISRAPTLAWAQAVRVRPVIVYLIGFPAAGKLTIARALASLAGEERHVVVVDNHHINNTIFRVIETDGVRSLPPRVWGFTSIVRGAVFNAIEELAPRSWSYVFTNVLIAGIDEKFVDEVSELARGRESAYVPVMLRCDVDELARRIVGEERRRRLKWVDPDALRSMVASTQLVDISGLPHALELDVTSLSPEESAAAIWAHAESVTG